MAAVQLVPFQPLAGNLHRGKRAPDGLGHWVQASRRAAPRASPLAAGVGEWDDFGPAGPSSTWSEFDTAFSSLDQQFASMHQNFRAAEEMAHSHFNDAFEQMQQMHQDSMMPWHEAGRQRLEQLQRSQQDLGPAEFWRTSGPSGSWSMHSRSSHNSSSGSYRSESFVMVQNGSSPAAFSIYAPEARPAASPLLGLALLAAAAYAAVAALFARGFRYTNFLEEERIKLSLGWPLLCVLSEKFRKQFGKAAQGLWQEIQALASPAPGKEKTADASS